MVAATRRDPVRVGDRRCCPFVAAALTLFFGKRTPGHGSVFGIAAQAVGFVMALAVLWHFVTGRWRATRHEGIEWFTIGPLHLELGQYVDGLTAVMLVVVTAVSLAVHVYSLGYMHGDVRYTWFYVVLSLFTGAMLTVVIANNLIDAAGRLGDHGRLLVPADRALVRGARELERGDQGVHHHAGRRRAVHVRDLRADLRHRVHHDEHRRDRRGDRRAGHVAGAA